MFSRKISRREVLKILFLGSVATSCSWLGLSKTRIYSHALAQADTPIDPLYSKVDYGDAKVAVIQDRNTYVAISDDHTIISSGTDPTDVINQALDKGLTQGRNRQEKLKLIGSFPNLKTIQIPSFVILDLSDAYLKQADATHYHLLTNIDRVNGRNTKIDIKGGIVDGNMVGNKSDFDDLGFSGEDVSNTIQLENVEDCSIEGITLINAYYHGIRIRNSVNVLVSNCTFKSVSRESISISGQGQPRGTCKRMRIFNNAIYDSGNSFITTLNASDSLISGNICEHVRGAASGITINGINNQVTNNIIRNSYADLISIAQIDLADYDASGSIVVGNICENTRLSNGITLLGYGCKNLVISSNRVANTAEGISISASNSDLLVNGNIINSCRNSGVRVSGVKGHDARYIRISNNVCYNNGTARDANSLNKAGIRLSSEEVGILHDCVVENNSCFDDRSERRTQDYGVLLVNTKDCIVRQNYTRNNIVSGISEVGNVDIVSEGNVGQT